MIDPESLCDREAEEAVLGAAMLDLAAADECLSMLRPEMFYREANRRTWAAIARLRAANAGCDLLTVGDELQRSGDLGAVGGLTYLSDLTAAVPATANAAYYARSVRDAYVRREIVRAAKQAMDAARDLQQSAAEVAATVDASLRAAADAAVTSEGPVPLSELVAPAFEFVEALYEGKQDPGISTGIAILDRNLNGGLHVGELCVIGAPPSEGKSALAQDMAMNIAAQARTVLYATPEMTARTVALRALANRGGIDLRKLWGVPRLEDADWPRLSHALSVLSEQGRTLYVEDRATTIEAIAAHARRLHSRQPLTLLVVDHLHELEWPKGADSENRAIGEIMRACKALAKSLGIAVLLLSQLNRAARNEKREPQMHDFRGSGAIEQHADAALLLQRRDDGDNPPREVRVDVHIRKQRNGRTGTIGLLHDRATGRFRDPREGREGLTA